MKREMTKADVLTMIHQTNNLFDETGRLFNQYNHTAAAGSVAAIEEVSFATPEVIRDVYYRGMQSLEVAADHLVAFTACIEEPSKTLAPATCVRGLLESCALGIWFLDSTIDAKTRVARCFAFRYEGFVQQIKIFGVESKQTEIVAVRKRMSDVDDSAFALGYSRLRNSKGSITGIGQSMPSITSLIGITLDRETEYRLLSGVAHGHHWATHQLGFREITTIDATGKEVIALEKVLHANVALYLGLIGVTSFTKLTWELWQLFGWNTKELVELFDSTFDNIGLNDNYRFWL
jgi:hypothetical protein